MKVPNIPAISNNVDLPDDYEYDEPLILITPSGVSLRDVILDNVIVIDLNGEKLDGEGVPSSELHMHLEIYRKREDIGAIVHTHPPYATGFSFTDKKIPRFEGFGEIKSPYIAEIEYAVPGSMELVESASNGLIDEDVLLLRNHGVVTVGENIDNAVLLAEFTESSAKTGFIICQLGGE
jgi:L-fuculose-phosphate aldolase